MRYFSDLLLSSKSQRPRDKKHHCHLRFADVLLLKRYSEESIASIFTKKNGTSGTNEFLPKMSLNRCRVFVARIDLAKIMKLMLRVSSESKYSLFFPVGRSSNTLLKKKMDVVVISGSLTCPGVVKSEFDLQNLGCKSCLRCGSSSSKAGLYFVRSRRLGGRLYKQGNFFLRSLLIVDERESGELFGKLF